MESDTYINNALLSFRNELCKRWGLNQEQFPYSPNEALKKKLDVNLFERIQIIEEVSLYFRCFANDIISKERFFSSYEEFKNEIKDIEFKARKNTRKIPEYATDNTRKTIKSVLIDFNPEKNTFMKFCFAMDIPLEICNQVLKAINFDEIYSRNIEEGLLLFYLNKFKEIDIKKLRKTDKLFQDIYAYEMLVHKHKETVTRVFGKEISDVIINNEDLSSDARIIIKKNSRIPSVFKDRKKKKATVNDVVSLLNKSISRYNELYSVENDEKEIKPFTTQFMNEQLKSALDVKEIELLLESQKEIWCKNRNKPLKKIIELILSSPKKIKEKNFSQLAFEIYCFYCYKDIHSEMFCFALGNKNVGKMLKRGDRDAFRDSHFDRDLTNALFGISQISRIEYITILIYLMNLNSKKEISVANIDTYLDESSFAVLGTSPTDTFIKRWLEIYNDSNFNNTLQDAFNVTIKEKSFNPLSWK